MEDQMQKDLLDAKRKLGSTYKKEYVRFNYFQYTRLLALYAQTHDKTDPSVLISKKEQKRLNDLTFPISEKLRLYKQFIRENREDLSEMSLNNIGMFNDMDFVKYYIPDKYKKIDLQELVDIYIDFFERIGYGDLIHKYFLNHRINFLVENKTNSGEYVSLLDLKSGYVRADSRNLNLQSLSFATHELGHAIDAETFLFPQQKKILLFSDLFAEIPSTAIEVLFNDYLEQQHIDDFGTLLLKNQSANKIKVYTMPYYPSFHYSFYYIDEDGDVVNAETGMGYPDFRNDLLYGIGYEMAYHLLLIYREDPNEFRRVFNRLITSRGECTNLRDYISKTGIDPDDFISGKLIRPEIEGEYKRLCKKIQRY